MTDATAVPAAELEPVLAGALALLTARPNADLDELAAMVATVPEAPLAAEAAPWPDLPKHIELTEEIRRALGKIPAMFNSVEITKRRSLAQAEVDLLTREQVILGQVGTVLASRMEVIKETIRVHMDVDAEETGVAVPKDQTGPDGEIIVAATPRDQKGHYLLAVAKKPHQVTSGLMAWSQEASAGGPVPSDGVLQKAYKDGTVSREDYLAVTREVRAFDEIKIRDLIRQAPSRGLAVLRRITVTGPARASLYLRKQT